MIDLTKDEKEFEIMHRLIINVISLGREGDEDSLKRNIKNYDKAKLLNFIIYLHNYSLYAIAYNELSSYTSLMEVYFEFIKELLEEMEISK